MVIKKYMSDRVSNPKSGFRKMASTFDGFFNCFKGITLITNNELTGNRYTS